MKTPKILFTIILSMLCLLVSACTGGGDTNFNTQVAVVTTQTQAAILATPTSVLSSSTQVPVPTDTPIVVSPTQEQLGTIAGSAQLQSPPTPPLTIYALDVVNGNWVYIETAQSAGEATFSLDVKPGVYQVFAFPAGIAYSQDGKSLSTLTVTAGQTVTGIRLFPPSPTQCGPAFGIPASPDGRYTAIAGATAECLAGGQETYEPIAADECNALSNALSQALNIPGMVTSPVAFDDYVNQIQGTGCQIVLAADGQVVSDIGVLDNAAKPVLQNAGWMDDMSYGAAGAGGYSLAYGKGNELCLMTVKAEPVDRSLCSQNEPLTVCWGKLTPEQKRFSYTLNCAQRTP